MGIFSYFRNCFGKEGRKNKYVKVVEKIKISTSSHGAEFKFLFNGMPLIVNVSSNIEIYDIEVLVNVEFRIASPLSVRVGQFEISIPRTSAASACQELEFQRDSKEVFRLLSELFFNKLHPGMTVTGHLTHQVRQL